MHTDAPVWERYAMPSKAIAVALLALGSLASVHAQSIFAGQQRTSPAPLAIGVGMSNFDLDWGYNRSGERRMSGISMTLDTDLPRVTGLLKGFGMEIEGRDLNYYRPTDLKRMRQSTILGGSTYAWPHYENVRPFVKYLWGMGSIDFSPKGHYSHDTRMVQAPGVGLECRLFGSMWLRGDYEYQFWPHLFGPHSLNPNGITVSTLYDIRRTHRPRN
jgi:hypothetical protein